MTDEPRIASGQFARGFNCAQSVLSAFADRAGLSTEHALRVAGPFGGGIARSGEMCGALSGALMALGLLYGEDRPEAKEHIYTIAREFSEQFRRRHGSILCRDLLHHDISTPEGLQAAREQNAFATVCPFVVEVTARALDQYIQSHPPE